MDNLFQTSYAQLSTMLAILGKRSQINKYVDTLLKEAGQRHQNSLNNYYNGYITLDEHQQIANLLANPLILVHELLCFQYAKAELMSLTINHPLKVFIEPIIIGCKLASKL